MSSRITEEGKKPRCIKMKSLNPWFYGFEVIRFYRLYELYYGKCIISPIIAKGNKFNGVKARW